MKRALGKGRSDAYVAPALVSRACSCEQHCRQGAL